MYDLMTALNNVSNRALDNAEIALGSRKRIAVRDDSHEYCVDVAKHDYDPTITKFTFIDLTEEPVIPF